jgi:hypothetical protein
MYIKTNTKNIIVGLGHKKRVMKWLSDTPYDKHHRHNSQRRSEGSGEWLLKTTKFKDWKTRPESEILWLRGSRMFSLELFPFSHPSFFFSCDHRLV